MLDKNNLVKKKNFVNNKKFLGKKILIEKCFGTKKNLVKKIFV